MKLFQIFLKLNALRYLLEKTLNQNEAFLWKDSLNGQLDRQLKYII
jgi:hypothetical protein